MVQVLTAKAWNSNPDSASDSQGDYAICFFFCKMGMMVTVLTSYGFHKDYMR